MFTTSTRTRSTLFAVCALALAAVLCTPVMANDSFDAVMQDAVARNDNQLLPEQYVGGATFVTQSGVGMTSDSAFRSTMRDAIARNDSQILPDHHNGGATFLR